MKKTVRRPGQSPPKRPSTYTTKPSKAQLFLNTVGTGSTVQPLEIREFCESYRVSHDTFTRLTGFSPRAVAHWAQGRKPSNSTARRLTETKRIFTALEKLIPGAAIGPWLKEPNPAFDGSTPLQVIERGETDRMWRMIYELESGEPA